MRWKGEEPVQSGSEPNQKEVPSNKIRHYPIARTLLHDLSIPLIIGPQICPYLPDRLEFKRVLRLGKRKISPELVDVLNEHGFRRTQNTAWRPDCGVCKECVSVRINVARFSLSRSQKRILKRNQSLSLRFSKNKITQEHFRLFQQYQAIRHPAGEMSDMTMTDLETMVETSAVNSKLAEWHDADGRLVAVCLVDLAAHSLSLVYSFFDSVQSQRGLGNYIILSLTEWAQRVGFDYVYLGFFIKNSPKMNYKNRFRPLEALTQSGWRDLA